MDEERRVRLDLGDGMQMLVVADQVGPSLVADENVIGRLEDLTGPIERVGRGFLDAARRAAPSKATVEIGIGLAVQEGHLVGLLAKAKGETSVKVTLEWTRESPPPAAGG